MAYLHRYRAQTPPIRRDGRKIIRAAISGGKKGEIMRRFAAVLAGLLVPAFLLAGAVVNSAMAQEKMAKAAVKPKVLLENDKVRVYEIAWKPGAENTTIASSAYRIVRALKGGTIRRNFAEQNGIVLRQVSDDSDVRNVTFITGAALGDLR